MNSEKAKEQMNPDDLLKQAQEILEKAKNEAKAGIKEAQAQAKELHKRAKHEAKEFKRELRKSRHHGRHSRKRDKFLHLRIDDELESKIQEEADRKRVPISILVRDILNDAFDLVESVADNVGHLVEDVVEDASRIARNFNLDCPELDPSDVLAWQDVKLNKNTECPFCGIEMQAGDAACMGVLAGEKAPVFVPKGCKYPDPDNSNPTCKTEDLKGEADAGNNTDE